MKLTSQLSNNSASGIRAELSDQIMLLAHGSFDQVIRLVLHFDGLLNVDTVKKTIEIS